MNEIDVTIPTDVSLYPYTPTRAVCIIFVLLFSVSTIVHITEAIQFMGRKGLWLFPTVCVAGFGEIIGWSCRLWSSFDTRSLAPYITQSICLVLAPTPLLAAVFIIASGVIARVGPQYSRLSPRTYSRMFLTFDMFSLSVQGGGGGLTTGSNTNLARLGDDIVLAGMILQLVSMGVFLVCMGEFFYRYLQDKPVRQHERDDPLYNQAVRPLSARLRLMSWSMLMTTLFLFVRSIYRTIELSHGANSKIMAEQTVFDVFDGAMVTLAIFTLNFFHPGFLLQPELRNDAFALSSTIKDSMSAPVTDRHASADELLPSQEQYAQQATRHV